MPGILQPTRSSGQVRKIFGMRPVIHNNDDLESQGKVFLKIQNRLHPHEKLLPVAFMNQNIDLTGKLESWNKVGEPKCSQPAGQCALGWDSLFTPCLTGNSS